MNTTKILKNTFALGTVSIFIAVLFLSAQSFAQSNLKKGWESFKVNDIKAARESFTNATKDGNDNAEAYLMLAVLASIDKSNDEAFVNFEKFYNSSPDPMPYVQALFVSDIAFDGYGKKSKEMLDLMKKIMNDPRCPGTLKDEIHSMMGNHYERSQEDKKALDEYAKIETIANWQILGEFDNISGSGFDKDYGALNYPKKEDGFKNKYGATINWFKLPPNRLDKWVDFTYNFATDNSICYAQSFVNSPSDQEVQFRIGVSGSLKTWINDNLVFSETEERNNGEDSYIFNVKLKKGYNRVLVQIGCSEIEQSNFMARITDDKGISLPGFSSTDEPQPYTKSPSYNVKVAPDFTESYFQKKIDESPDKLINYLILAIDHVKSNKNYEARKILVKAQDMAPKCSYIYYKLIENYSSEGNKTDLEIGIAWLKDNDPENPVSLRLLYNEEIEKENYKEATGLLEKMEKLYGKNAYTIEKRINLAGKESKQEEIIKLANEGYEKYPDLWYFVNFRQLIESSVNKNTEAAIKVIKKYLKNNFNTEAYKRLAKVYFDKSDFQDGVEQYETLIKKHPFAIGFYKDLGDIYFDAGKYEKAADYYKKCIAIAPYISGYWTHLAKCYSNLNNDADAKEAYKKAIHYMPTNYQARKALRKIENKKDVYDYFEQPDITDIFKKSPDASEYPDDNSLVLYEETQKVVYSGGATEERYIVLVKVFNADGIDNWKEYEIGTYSSQRLIIEKAEVLKKNGSRVAAETDGGKVIFKSLEAGDAISLTYKIENYAIGKLSPYFSDKRYFTHWLPYLKTRYSLLISPDVKFQSRFSKDTIIPKISTADEFQLYTWTKENQAAMRSEDKMPKLIDVAQVLYLSSFPDWTYISNWYSDLASTKAKSDYEVKETVANLMKGKENFTDRQKVEEIYNYIVKNIRYSSVSFLQGGEC